jgi:hypothetical protein
MPAVDASANIGAGHGMIAINQVADDVSGKKPGLCLDRAEPSPSRLASRAAIHPCGSFSEPQDLSFSDRMRIEQTKSVVFSMTWR